MKKILTFAGLALFSFSLFAVDIFSISKLQGEIKSFTRTDYAVTTKFGNYFRTPSAKTTHNYTEGKETEEIHLTPRDVVIRKVIWNYDEEGNLSEKVCSNAENELEWKTAMTYVDGVQQDHSEYDNAGNLKNRTIYTYTDGLLTDETDYNADGALMWKTIYTYTDGIVNVISKYNSKGELDTAETYKYNEDGKLDTIVTTDAFSNETTQIVFRYANGQISELLSYNSANKLVNRVLVKYDAAGNVAKISEYEVADKFGTTVNELINMIEYVFEY